MPQELIYILASTVLWFLLIVLVRSRSLSRIVSTSNEFGRCLGVVAFVSNAMDRSVNQKIVALGSRHSLDYSLLPSASITSIDPSVKASEGSTISGLSYAIGRQPLRIKSHSLRILLLNLGLIDSAAVPLSMFSKINSPHKRSVSIIELCQDQRGCVHSGIDQLRNGNLPISLSQNAFEKYIINFHPHSLPKYKKHCN